MVRTLKERQALARSYNNHAQQNNSKYFKCERCTSTTSECEGEWREEGFVCNDCLKD